MLWGPPALFRRHARIALGSAAEVECLLRLAIETGIVAKEVAAEVQRDVADVIGLLRGLVRSFHRFEG